MTHESFEDEQSESLQLPEDDYDDHTDALLNEDFGDENNDAGKNKFTSIAKLKFDLETIFTIMALRHQRKRQIQQIQLQVFSIR